MKNELIMDTNSILYVKIANSLLLLLLGDCNACITMEVAMYTLFSYCVLAGGTQQKRYPISGKYPEDRNQQQSSAFLCFEDDVFIDMTW